MPRSRPPYPDEFRREAVALVRSSSDRSVPTIARDLGISGQTLRNWVRQAEVDRGARHGLSSDERDESAPLAENAAGAVASNPNTAPLVTRRTMAPG